jgi:hypothetical protein
LSYYATDAVHVHAGYGLDAPKRSTLARLQRARNETLYGSLFWDVSRVFQLSLEAQYRSTEWVELPSASGAVILSQALFRF